VYTTVGGREACTTVGRRVGVPGYIHQGSREGVPGYIHQGSREAGIPGYMPLYPS